MPRSSNKTSKPQPVAPVGFDPGFLWRALVIIAAVFWIYWPTLHGEWLDWDDSDYLATHLHLQSPGELWKTWLAPGSLQDYYPIESAVLWVQWQLWHYDTLGYHLTNVVLHIVSALLVWRLFAKIGVHHAWWGGLLFAVHPLMVESVAWIVELKNTLSLPPLLLAMCVYIDYVKRKQSRDYFLALGLFLVAMLCKTSGLMFPAVALLYVWWKRRQITWADIRDCVPFFAILLVLGLLTASLQHQAQTGSTIDIGWMARLATTGWELVFFVSKFFFPGVLLPIYPSGLVLAPTFLDSSPLLLLVGLFGMLGTKWDQWGRDAVLGVGFFLINMAPVSAFMVMNAATATWNLDHVVYLPMIGLIGLTVAGLGKFYDGMPASLHPIAVAIVSIPLALLAWQSHFYSGKFVNRETLWTYTLDHNPNCWEARNNLGLLLMHAGRPEEAMIFFKQEIALTPDNAQGYLNAGVDLLLMGHFPEAVESLKMALKADPDNASAHYNYGNALLQTGHPTEAIAQYQQALQLRPLDYAAHCNWGDALIQTHRLTEAIDQYQQSLAIYPDYTSARYNLASALFQSGRTAEAIEQFEQIVKVSPDSALAHNNLGIVYARTGRRPEAIEQFETALKLKPDYTDARNNLTRLQALPKHP